MVRPKAWSVNADERTVTIEWQDGRKSAIPMIDIDICAFIMTYMTPIPQATLREHMDMICNGSEPEDEH